MENKRANILEDCQYYSLLLYYISLIFIGWNLSHDSVLPVFNIEKFSDKLQITWIFPVVKQVQFQKALRACIWESQGQMHTQLKDQCTAPRCQLGHSSCFISLHFSFWHSHPSGRSCYRVKLHMFLWWCYSCSSSSWWSCGLCSGHCGGGTLTTLWI